MTEKKMDGSEETSEDGDVETGMVFLAQNSETMYLVLFTAPNLIILLRSSWEGSSIRRVSGMAYDCDRKVSSWKLCGWKIL